MERCIAERMKNEDERNHIYILIPQISFYRMEVEKNEN